ncbi:MAG: hypothetical protein U9Q27_01230 [Patescibacteria group bacterium]|nr:hypothetical protein [Patescibacteria group bacterium]
MTGIIPKPKKEIPKYQDILFYCSLFLLFAILICYFAFNHFENKSFKEFQAKQSELSEIGTPEQKQAEKRVLIYESKIKDFGELLDKHKYTSVFLEKMEKMAYNDTNFTNLSLNVLEQSVVLRGKASSFKDLGEQLNLLKKQNNIIESVEMTNMAMDKDGAVNFTFNLKIKPEAFIK